MVRAGRYGDVGELERRGFAQSPYVRRRTGLVLPRFGGSASDGAGFRTFDIRPKYVLGLDSVEYTHKTVYGDISIKWNKTADNRYTLRCRVPVGTTATVWVPVENGFNPVVKTTCGKEVEEKVRCELGAGRGVVWHVQMLYGYALYEVGAGEYEFESVCRNPLTGGVICL